MFLDGVFSLNNVITVGRLGERVTRLLFGRRWSCTACYVGNRKAEKIVSFVIKSFCLCLFGFCSKDVELERGFYCMCFATLSYL